MASFEVRVVNSVREPVKSASVRIEFTGFRGISVEKYTDDDGVAKFNDYEEGEIKMFADGRDYGKFRYQDGKRITIMK